MHNFYKIHGTPVSDSLPHYNLSIKQRYKLLSLNLQLCLTSTSLECVANIVAIIASSKCKFPIICKSHPFKFVPMYTIQLICTERCPLNFVLYLS